MQKKNHHVWMQKNKYIGKKWSIGDVIIYQFIYSFTYSFIDQKRKMR